jgi:DNA-binding SARP family transcriptional activator/TolB-like protein/Tfp pilus assembly protein PilF
VFTLETFGGLALRAADGPVTARAGQRRRLALLAVLAAERRAVSRDKLLGLFWPESDVDRARHLLADTLYVLRAGLGEDALRTLGDDVALNEQVVASDVSAFLDAVDAGEAERAVTVYTGPFLDGIFISDAPAFERWVDATRQRLETERRRCLERLAVDAAARGDHTESVRRWQQLAAADRVSSRVAVGLIRALVRSGDLAAALQFARVHEEIVRAELDAEPDPAVASLVKELRLARDGPGPTAVAAPSGDQPVSVEPPPASDVPPSAPDVPRLTGARARWRRTGLVAVVAGLAALAVVATAPAVARWRGSRTARTPNVPTPSPAAASVAPPRIVVLPFDAIGTTGSSSDIADGMTGELRMALDRFHELRLVAQTSAAAVVSQHLSVPEISRVLGASYVVEGTVRRNVNELRVEVRLIDDTGVSVWSRTYDREYAPRSVMFVEQEIARDLATALRWNLAAGSGFSPGRVPANTAALEAYNPGTIYLKSRNLGGVRKADDAFTRATRLDPTYAAAYAGLADAYASLAVGNIADLPATEYFVLAQDAARHALALDSTLAEAHAALGYTHVLYDLDWRAADVELTRATSLEPSYENAHVYRTILFEWRRQFAEALNEVRDARDVDPLSPLINVEVGRALFFARHYEEAEKQLRHAIELDSVSLRAHLHLGQVLVQRARYAEAVAELQTAVRLSAGNSSRPLALLAYAFSVAGDSAGARRLLDSLETRRRRQYVPAFDFAIVYAGLGDDGRTLEWLERSFGDHSIRPYLWDPTFDRIRSDKRLRELLARHHLPVT